jgi:hypothetical protein
MAIRSIRGLVVGATVALVVPVLSWSAAALVRADVVSAAAARPLLDVVGLLAWVALLVLGPLGIAIAGWSAGIRDVLTWVAWLILLVPAFVVVWFVAVAELSGALGNPF